MRPSLHQVLLLSLCSLVAHSLVFAATTTGNALLDHATGASTPGPKLLYVWQYDCIFDWEPVQIRDHQQSSSMITWLLSLRDRLTLTRQKPLGEPLMIPVSWYVPRSVSHIRDVNDTRIDVSLRAVIEAQLEEDPLMVMLPKYLMVVYQLSLLPDGPRLEDLFVTSSRTFWHVVEASAASGQLVYTPDSETDAVAIAPITGYAVAIPTMDAIHGQESWRGDFVSDKYGDHSAWDVDTIVQMMHEFFRAARAVSLPDLAEYHWRLDKVVMHHLLQDHFHQDPQNRVPHIPSTIVNPPVPKQIQGNLCYQSRYLSDEPVHIREQDIHATAVALLEAAQQLEGDADARQIQKANAGSGSSQPVRKYFLKRNYSAGAKHVLSFTLASLSSLHPNAAEKLQTSLVPSAQEAGNSKTGGVQHSAHGTPGDQQDSSTCQATDNSTIDHANHQQRNHVAAQSSISLTDFNCTASSQTALKGTSGETDSTACNQMSPRGCKPARASHQTGANSTTSKHQPVVLSKQAATDAVFHDAQQLFKAAEQMIRESCNEEWLLQPFIPDMESNEYRVYLIGGAEATGRANDTAPVYTPAFHHDTEEGKRRVYVWNVTLPEGFFSRSPMTHDAGKLPWLTPPEEIDQQDLNSTMIDQFRVPYFPYPLWRDESMHGLLTHVALSAAQAIAKSGRPIRMAQHVMLRVDIALTVQGHMAKPFINEAHVFNDAGLSFDVWPPCNQQHQAAAATGQANTADAPNVDANHSSIAQQQCNDRKSIPKNHTQATTKSYLSSVFHTIQFFLNSNSTNSNSVLQQHVGASNGFLTAQAADIGDADICAADDNMTANENYQQLIAADEQGSGSEMGCGFLLAAKLWQEVLQTVAVQK